MCCCDSGAQGGTQGGTQGATDLGSACGRAPEELKYAFASPETAENAVEVAQGDLTHTQQQVPAVLTHHSGLWFRVLILPAALQAHCAY